MEMLITILVALLIVGVVLYLITLIHWDETIKQIIRIVVIAAVILWLLGAFFGFGPGFHLGFR